MLIYVESRYSQRGKEALAAVWACERLWIYQMGKPFVLVADNRVGQLIFNNLTTDESGKDYLDH